MSNYPPQLHASDIAIICAEHTRRVQLLTGQFWQGDIDRWHYRRRSRELTQQFVQELENLLNRAIR